MKKFFSTIALTALSFSPITFAEQTSPSWNNISASYTKANIDEIDEISPKGFSLTGSYLLNDNVFILADLMSVSDDLNESGTNVDLEFNTQTLGLGYKYALNNSSDLFASLSYENIELKAKSSYGSESEDESGYGLSVGIRSMVTNQVELMGSLKHIKIDGESETFFNVGAYYAFNKNISIGASFNKNDEVDFMNITARYSF